MIHEGHEGHEGKDLELVPIENVICVFSICFFSSVVFFTSFAV